MVPSKLHSFDSESADRPCYFFCVTGLSTRDEILLKSLVRLLQNVTRHHWMYSPDGNDMVVIGPEASELSLVKPDQRSKTKTTARARLWVGSARDGQQFQISLPLHFKDLEAALNRLGDWLVALPTEASDKQEVLQAKAPEPGNQSGSEWEPADTVRLLRWPPAIFLTSRERAKAAALMLKAPIKLSTLKRKTGLSFEECVAFVEALPHAVRTPAVSSFATSLFLVASSQFATDAATPGFEAKGSRNELKEPDGRGRLLSRIRAKLGLKA